jgi:hypothetical protein
MAGEIITVGTLVNSVRISRGNVVRSDVNQNDLDEPDRERNSIDVVSLSPQALALARNGGPAETSAPQHRPETQGREKQQQPQNLPARLLDIRI